MEVVSAERLRVTFGDKDALAGVDLEVRGPGVVGVLGPNGAGKTTLLDVLSGVADPTSGSVRILGSALGPGGRGYPRERVGVVLQREFVMEGITVGEYAELFAEIQRVPGGAARVLARSGLEGRARTAIDRVSGGEAQRLFIAAATVHEPELVLLDEPTSQLDPDNKRRIGALLRELAEERAVLLTTHDLREAERICDRAFFVTDGRIRAHGTVRELVDGVPGAASLEDAFFFHAKTRIGDRGDARGEDEG